MQVCATYGVSRVMPSIAITGIHHKDIISSVTNYQVQSHNTVTTIVSHIYLGISTTFIISNTIPIIVFTSFDFNSINNHRVYGQLQCKNEAA